VRTDPEIVCHVAAIFPEEISHHPDIAALDGEVESGAVLRDR
jgi:pterin-4a-carbinolamine dehydratase